MKIWWFSDCGSTLSTFSNILVRNSSNNFWVKSFYPILPLSKSTSTLPNKRRKEETQPQPSPVPKQGTMEVPKARQRSHFVSHSWLFRTTTVQEITAKGGGDEGDDYHGQMSSNVYIFIWLVVWTPLKNMKVNWDDNRNPILMGKCQKWQPNHQPVFIIYLSRANDIYHIFTIYLPYICHILTIY